MEQAAVDDAGLIKLADNQPKVGTTDSFKDYNILNQMESAELKIAPFNQNLAFVEFNPLGTD